MGFLRGPLGSAGVIIAFVVIVLMGGGLGLKSCQVSSLKGDVDDAQRELTREQTAHAQTRAELQAVRNELNAQNAAVEALGKECAIKAQAADLAGIRALAAARQRAQPTPGHGAEELNQWLRDSFPQR